MTTNSHNKLNIALLFGGQSAEHEVSISSAQNIVKALNEDKYNAILIGIDKQGNWSLINKNDFLSLKRAALDLNSLHKNNSNSIAFIDREGIFNKSYEKLGNVDIVFPILHGPKGEDGSIQGLLKSANLPFVGADVLGSAIGMDKDVMKRLLKQADIPTADFLVFKNYQKDKINFDRIKEKLGLPFFVKPANLGSSVGISKVNAEQDFSKAIEAAFSYDEKIIIEKFIKGKEIECSVLGNEQPIASKCGEIIPSHDFYSYQAKYLDEKGAELIIPAQISKALEEEVQKVAIKTFQVLECQGMARVDFFIDQNKKIFVNEINTIPGFTSTSMYPKLWKASGISNEELIDRLIELAIKRHEKQKRFKANII